MHKMREISFNARGRKQSGAAGAVAWAVVLLCAIALFTGCGDSAGYQLAPVSGVVTLDGQPAPYTQIIFQPKGSADNLAPGPGSTAYCDDQGRFELETVRGEPGAVVGLHAVQIYAHGPPKPTSSDVDVGPKVEEAFPARFNVETQLTFEVPDDGTTTADFNLATDP